MARPFDVLHVKKRTAGSSNELSFDVLDAARDGVNIQRGKPQRVAVQPRSQQTASGVGSVATFAAEPEVNRRKGERRSHERRFWAIAVVAIIALVGTAAYFGVSYFQYRADFNGRYHMLVDRFIEVDQTLAQVDSLMVDPLNEEEEQARATVLQSMARMNRELNTLSAEAEGMRESSSAAGQGAALDAISSSVEARCAMIQISEQTFELSQKERESELSATSAWQQVISADDIARKAMESANDATTEQATRSAREQADAARIQLLDAGKLLEAAEKNVEGLSLQEERSYLDKRVESLEAAIETLDALMSYDRAKATEANAAYTEKDEEAASLAAELSSSPASKVRAVYEGEIEALKKQYEEARTLAISSDAAVRSYL